MMITPAMRRDLRSDSDIDAEIVTALRRHGKMTPALLRRLCHISTFKWEQASKRLRDAGLVRVEGATRGIRYSAALVNGCNENCLAYPCLDHPDGAAPRDDVKPLPASAKSTLDRLVAKAQADLLCKKKD